MFRINECRITAWPVLLHKTTFHCLQQPRTQWGQYTAVKQRKRACGSYELSPGSQFSFLLMLQPYSLPPFPLPCLQVVALPFLCCQVVSDLLYVSEAENKNEPKHSAESNFVCSTRKTLPWEEMKGFVKERRKVRERMTRESHCSKVWGKTLAGKALDTVKEKWVLSLSLPMWKLRQNKVSMVVSSMWGICTQQGRRKLYSKHFKKFVLPIF